MAKSRSSVTSSAAEFTRTLLTMSIYHATPGKSTLGSFNVAARQCLVPVPSPEKHRGNGRKKARRVWPTGSVISSRGNEG